MGLPALVALLAIVIAGCGGDDDSSSTEATTTGQNSGKTADGNGGGDGKKEKPSNQSGSDDSSDESADNSGEATAQQHEDSGGGSAQFRVKGGDNSVQDFGSEASEPEFDEAAAAVHGFFDARVRGDWEAACTYLAKDVSDSLVELTGNSKELQGEDCAGILEALSKGAPQSAFKAAAVADVGSLRIEGERAFVLYRGSGGTVFAMPMQNEGGSWKLASLAGTPIS